MMIEVNFNFQRKNATLNSNIINTINLSFPRNELTYINDWYNLK